MTPLLSLILLLLTLFGFLVALVNAVRKYNDPSMNLRWIVIPLLFSIVALLVNLFTDQNKWNIKNLVGELSLQGQDSLEIENEILSDSIFKKENERKIVKRLKRDTKESQSEKDTLTLAGREAEQTNQIIGQRTITLDQRKRFVNFLRDEPKGDFRIEYISGDAEALEYSKSISNMLNEAGYHLSGEITDFAPAAAVEGISIVINRNETQPRYARSIFFAFRSIGINIVAERNKQMAKPLEVLITVGHRK